MTDMTASNASFESMILSLRAESQDARAYIHALIDNVSLLPEKERLKLVHVEDVLIKQESLIRRLVLEEIERLEAIQALVEKIEAPTT